MFIVGGEDAMMLDVNRKAMARMSCQAVLHIVPGANDPFEDGSTLAHVTGLAQAWFTDHLLPGSAAVADPPAAETA